MTIQIDEAPPKERSIELLARKREQRSEATVFSAQPEPEPEPEPKPLAAFDALPDCAALPLTWPSTQS
jgi:hypothetical protein